MNEILHGMSDIFMHAETSIVCLLQNWKKKENIYLVGNNF